MKGLLKNIYTLVQCDINDIPRWSKIITDHIQTKNMFIQKIASKQQLIQALNAQQMTIMKQKRLILIDNLAFLLTHDTGIIQELEKHIRKGKKTPVVIISDYTSSRNLTKISQLVKINKCAKINEKQLYMTTRELLTKMDKRYIDEPTMVARMMHENYKGDIQGFRSIVKGLNMEPMMLTNEWGLLPVYLDYTCFKPGKLSLHPKSVKYTLLMNKVAQRTTCFTKLKQDKLKQGRDCYFS
jgi:hypothetical protein